MQSIVLASGNLGKLREFKQILIPLGIEVIPMGEAGFHGDIVEDGETFADNAKIKALAVWRETGLPVAADDSGLCVDCLGGRPGIHSARYHGADTSYADKIAHLLEEMKGMPDSDRTARFVASIAYVDATGCCRIFEAACEGVIGHAPSGEGGFGYDPVFYVRGQSFAELSADEKNEISHRGRALRDFGRWMTKIHVGGK